MSDNNQHVERMVSIPMPPIRTQLDEMENLFENLRRDWYLSFAPHTVCLNGCAYVAINRYCIIEGAVIEGDQHIVNFGTCESTLIFNRIIHSFLNQFGLKKKYTISVHDPLDCNGKVAYTAILVAVWKLIQLHEHHIGTEIDLEKRLYSVFDEYNIELDAKEAVFMATVEGSSYEIHFKTFPEDVDDIRENSKAKIEKFTDKYDLVYVQTDAHSTDFEPEKMAVRFDLEELKSQFTDDFADPIDIAKMMKSYSSKRLALKNKKNKTDQIDIDSEVAMNTYCMECVGESYVHGYNVQQGGILIAMKKNGFMKDRILSNISKSIVESFTTTISSIKFQLFQPGMGASVLDEHVINSIDISHQTTVPVNTKTTIKRRQTIQTSVPEETDTCSESDSDMFVNEFSDIDSKRHKSEEEEPHDETFDD